VWVAGVGCMQHPINDPQRKPVNQPTNQPNVGTNLPSWDVG
jgi:hypothetical protein